MHRNRCSNKSDSYGFAYIKGSDAALKLTKRTFPDLQGKRITLSYTRNKATGSAKNTNNNNVQPMG